MSEGAKFIPAGSQTVGPYFRIGLQHLIECGAKPGGEGIRIQGRVLDRDGAPVSDAMLEAWSPGCEKVNAQQEVPSGFLRIGTDIDGAFTMNLPRPKPVPTRNGASQAPHFLVLVFARGLLRHLITRVYLDDEHANATDPVLLSVPEERRRTLIAQLDESGVLRWDVILQGTNETVFFVW